MPVGPLELGIILVIIIIIFGVGKLPQIGGALGQGIREFRDSSRTDDADGDASATTTTTPPPPPPAQVETNVSSNEPAKEEL
jgi:sec-independent protein translocase protein TatA